MIGKPGKPAKFEFEEGEMLRFRLQGEKHWNKGLIQGLHGDKIRLHYVTIDIQEIAAIDISDRGKGRFLATVSQIFLIGGIGFSAIDQFNRTLVNNDPDIDEKSLLIGGALASTGIFLKLIRKRTVRIGNGYSIKISEF